MRKPPLTAPSELGKSKTTVSVARPNPADPDKPTIYVAEQHTIMRSYRLITPLFGGGVGTSENDLSMLIRGTSIRGQLRFWWRACFGGSSFEQNTNITPKDKHKALLKLMYERESALWGNAANKTSGNPSRVRLQVEVTNRGMDVRVSAMNSPYGYAAFPLQDKPNATVREGVEFTLTLDFPQHLDDTKSRDLVREVEATLWAWETFGGIGARIRRGFGVIQRVDGQSAYPFRTNAELQNQLRTIVGANNHWPEKVPHLHPAMQLRLIQPASDPLQTWAKLLKRYKDFRQQRNPGSQPNRPGRSRWPEPDALRRLLGRRSRLHTQPVTKVDAFPRAAFGLPIIFHFKDQDDPNATLKPANHDRFASPLILKPVSLGGQHAGLLAVLCNTSLENETVIVEKLPRRPGDKDLVVYMTDQQANALTRSDRTPLFRDRTKPTDVFAALLADFSAEECL